MDYENNIIKEYLNSMILHPISPEEVKCPENYFYKWNADDKFLTKNHTISIEKSPTNDFVILNLADIQCHDAEAFSEVGDFYEETIDKLIKKTKPDLITLTGDNAFDSLAHLKLI